MDHHDGNVPAVLTRMDLVRKVSASIDLPLEEAQLIVDSIFDAMVRGLRAGEKVEIRRFGSFRIRQRGAHIGRNPNTGARVEVRAKSVVYFTPSQDLREVVNAN